MYATKRKSDLVSALVCHKYQIIIQVTYTYCVCIHDLVCEVHILFLVSVNTVIVLTFRMRLWV